MTTPAPTRTEEVRRQNTHKILATLRQLPSISRTNIVAETSLSAATVSAISANLLQQKILINTEDTTSANVKSKRGRPRVRLAFNPQAGYVVTLRFSINQLSAQLTDYNGQTLQTVDKVIDSLHISATDFRLALIQIINQLIAAQNPPAIPLRYIAIAVQGLVDAEGKKMLWSPISSLRDLPIHEMLEEVFGIPAIVANDCNMIAEALHHQQPIQFGNSFAAILLSQGIGMGLMINGKQFIGQQSSASEFGHLVYIPDGASCRCGQRGCIEAYASDYAIWQRVQKIATSYNLSSSFNRDDLQQIIASARSQDGVERDAFREAGRAIGFGLRSLFALIDPVPVAFIGDNELPLDLLESEIRKVFNPSSKMLSASDVHLSCFDNAEELIQQGSALTALRKLDRQFSGIVD